MSTKFFIVWNEGRTQGAIFDAFVDAESALDGEHRVMPGDDFLSISALAEAFYDLYGSEDECTIEEVDLETARVVS